MFTGIVESTAKVLSFEERKAAWLLKLDVPEFVAKTLSEGDSLACNGCCLTVISRENCVIGFELLEETIRLTNFEGIKEGALVNIERPLAAAARLGGHFVSGHIDVRSRVRTFVQKGKNYYLEVDVPEEFRRYVVYKGSVAIDGIALTIAEANPETLAVWLIPHTLEVTNLSECAVGKFVNHEFDILAKYVEKIASGMRDKSPYQP